jgi:hypothetical protein
MGFVNFFREAMDALSPKARTFVTEVSFDIPQTDANHA